MKIISNLLKTIGYLALICLTTLSFTGCENDLEVDLPNSQLTGTSVFLEVATARAALSQIYADIRDNAPFFGTADGINVLLGLYADDLKYYGQGGLTMTSFYTHNIHSNNFLVQGFWSGGYTGVYKCNAVLEGLIDSPLPEEEKELLKGEALFLRAFIHFYLLNLYGDIPYITTTDYLLNAKVKRQSEDEVYSLIIFDLEQAKAILPATDLSGQYIYATKGAANTLLARLYLYRQDWQKTVETASEVLEDSPYSWTDDLTQVFISSGSSVIWQLPPVSGLATAEARTFIFEVGPPPLVALQPELINSFDPEDQRLSQWIGSVSDAGQTWYYPYKYKTRNAGEGPEEFSVVMRLAEVLLIRAEANAHLNNISGAQSDLNKVRNRAGLSNTNATTVDSLFEAVQTERRHELFSEFGHRWFDLKRTRTAETVLSPIKPGWRNTDLLLPIPQEELLLNPNLQPQNLGY